MEIDFASWNVGGCRAIGEGSAACEDLGHFRRTLDAPACDILCLQEVHCYGDGRPSQAAVLAGQLGYRYLREQPLCRSHLDPEAELSLAILCRHRISTASYVPLPTPRLRKRMRGTTWTLHPKGALVAQVSMPGHDLNVVCAHAHPFHLFDRDPLEPAFTASREALDATLLNLAAGPTLAGVDLNDARFELILPRAQRRGFRSLFRAATTPSGLQQDHLIYLTDALAPCEWQVVQTAADHHLIRGVFKLEGASFQPPPGAAGEMQSASTLAVP